MSLNDAIRVLSEPYTLNAAGTTEVTSDELERALAQIDVQRRIQLRKVFADTKTVQLSRAIVQGDGRLKDSHDRHDGGHHINLVKVDRYIAEIISQINESGGSKRVADLDHESVINLARLLADYDASLKSKLEKYQHICNKHNLAQHKIQLYQRITGCEDGLPVARLYEDVEQRLKTLIELVNRQTTNRMN